MFGYFACVLKVYNSNCKMQVLFIAKCKYYLRKGNRVERKPCQESTGNLRLGEDVNLDSVAKLYRRMGFYRHPCYK